MSPHAMICTCKHPDTLLLRGPAKVEHRTQEILGKTPEWTQGTLQVGILLVWILGRCSSSHKVMVTHQWVEHRNGGMIGEEMFCR